MSKALKQAGTVVLALILLLAFVGCGGKESLNVNPHGTTIEMELTSNYSDTEPFINARLFAVTESVDLLGVTVSVEMQGESGFLEIANNETGDVLWSEFWNGGKDNGLFTVSLTNVEKENEYVIRFTGTGIEQAKIVAIFESDLVVEQERPRSRT